MMSNVKKKDVPLISISLVAILFIAAALSLFPQQSADAANAIYTFVTRFCHGFGPALLQNAFNKRGYRLD